MKKIWKSKWFPTIVAIAILVLAVLIWVIMELFGWRFSYAPELENKWEAVSAVASWVQVIISILGVIASFVAIWFAIQVPKKIADRQDRIALFEKRWEVYNIFLCCQTFSQSISKEDEKNSEWDIKRVRMLFIVAFSSYPVIEDTSEKALFVECTNHFIRAKKSFDTASFLFSCDVNDYTRPVSSALSDLLYKSGNSEQIKKYCKQYQTDVQSMKEKLLPEIKKELLI